MLKKPRTRTAKRTSKPFAKPTARASAESAPLRVDPEFQDLIPLPSDAELEALEFSILAAGGARVPIDVWGDTIVDGHNRYRICTRLGLPYQTNAVSFDTREEVRTWIFHNQASRRNLSPDQLLMLAAMRGITSTNGTALQRERAAALAAAGKGSAVLAGKLSLALAWGAHARATGLLQPRTQAPRGPSTVPHIPYGHELAGVSTLSGPDGAKRLGWDKTRVAGADEPPVPTPENHLITRTAAMMRGDGTTVVQWIGTKADEVRREAAMREAWERHAEIYSGLAGTVAAPSGCLADTLTVYPIGDPHIGLLAHYRETGDSHDLKIGTTELLACMKLMVDQAPASREAIVANLGDFLHAQDDSQLTPGHHNKLDVDGRHFKVLDAAHAMLRGMLDYALMKHSIVRVRNLPGNHDPRVAAELMMWLRAVYEREPRVVVEDAVAAHQYDRFGCVLLGWHHGDRTRAAELPAIMAEDRAEDWGQTTERVWHVGHVHHLTRSETPGCVVETHRTLAGADAWHRGRYRAKRALQAITYHGEYGEFSRVTIGLARVRAALVKGAA